MYSIQTTRTIRLAIIPTLALMTPIRGGIMAPPEIAIIIRPETSFARVGIFSSVMAKINGKRLPEARPTIKIAPLAIITEGANHILGFRSPNFVYRPQCCQKLKLLLKNYSLSDDIAFRFSNRDWPEWPLTAEKFARWVSHVNGNGNVVNLFMDYETFGEHQWEDTGIFQFLRAFPDEVIKRKLTFNTPSEVVDMYKPVAEIDVGDFSTVSWADMERDTSAWLGNDMQRRCFEEAKQLGPYVKKTGDRELLRIWKHLLTSDHYYYMCTKWLEDGDVHSYFSIHSSPFDAAVNFMAVIMDFKAQVFERLSEMD